MSGLISNYRGIHNCILIYRFSFLIIISFLLLSAEIAKGQNKVAESVKEAEKYLEARGEVYLGIPVSQKDQISRLSDIISIDRRDSSFIYLYASPKGFDSLITNNLPFRVEIPPSLRIRTIKTTGEFPGEWNRYPSFTEYVTFIQKLAESYPDLCCLDTIGFSVNNRVILALKISDKANQDETEPCFLFTSTMHGDEPGGFYLLLRFADWLLSEYGKNAQITGIVDHLQIWINPLSNPDGLYFMGNESISGAKRFNINNIDLNRNFPDPRDGLHPDGEEYQPETLAMMKFMESGHFTLSANLHGGAELVNYPWDTWAKFHPDDAWYRFISRQYADTVHKLNQLYMTDMVNGITNGFAWYEISGGRQDYVNYFLHGREVTLELSHDKIPPEDTLNWFWEANRRSLLNYMEQTIFGITGTITDRVTGRPVRAEIEIPGHDSLNSFIWSDSISGDFYRLIKAGSYNLRIIASRYRDTIIYSVNVADFSTTFLDIHLTPVGSGTTLPAAPLINVINPFTGDLKISLTANSPEKIMIDLYDIGGRNVVKSYTARSVPGDNTFIVNCESLSPGLYILKFTSPSISYSVVLVKAK
jgi:hypothetical protein